MEETSLKHTHAVKLSSGQRSVEESKQFCGSLPLSIKSPREVPNYFLDNDWERVKKGKTWIIWQSLSLPAKTKLSLKQHNVAGSIGPCVPWLLSTWEPQPSCRAWQLQMLHTSYWDTHLKTAQQCQMAQFSLLLPAEQHFLGTREQHQAKRMPGLITCSELQLPDTKSLCVCM